MCDSLTGIPVTESHVVKGHSGWVKLISNENNLLLCYGLDIIHA